MEPKIIKKDIQDDKIINNQKKILILSILCMVILLLSSSYAIMTNFSQKEDAITFSTGNLEMTILNGEETFSLINLNNKLPESDESGLYTATVIPITLKNTGTMLIGEYTIKLVSDLIKVSTLNEEYIRFSVSEDNITYSDPTTLTTNENVIYIGSNLDIEQVKIIYLKIWIGENLGKDELNKTYYGDLEIMLKQQYVDNISTIINIYDAGVGKITFTVVDNGAGADKYCVNQSQKDTTDCTWYNAIVGSQTTEKIVTENGNYYVHIKDLNGNIGHSEVVVMNIDLTPETFIIEKYGTGGLVAINTNGTLYNGTGTIREYRYSGATVNNYVFFDTDDDGVKDTNEIWRIVGIFKNSLAEWNLKLMRNTTLTSEELPSTYKYNGTTFSIEYSSGRVYWNSTKTGTNYNDWTTAGLQYYLNGTNGYYGTLSSGAKSVLDINYTYYLGNHMYNRDTTISAYLSERDTSNIWDENQATWSKSTNSNSNGIALLYPSDYGYSASSNYWNETILYKYNNTSASTSWMYKTTNHNMYEWFLSPSSGSSSSVASWVTSGLVGNNDVSNSGGSAGVRPVLNLLSIVRLEDASGEETNPYQIIIE